MKTKNPFNLKIGSIVWKISNRVYHLQVESETTRSFVLSDGQKVDKFNYTSSLFVQKQFGYSPTYHFTRESAEAHRLSQMGWEIGNALKSASTEQLRKVAEILVLDIGLD